MGMTTNIGEMSMMIVDRDRTRDHGVGQNLAVGAQEVAHIRVRDHGKNLGNDLDRDHAPNHDRGVRTADWHRQDDRGVVRRLPLPQDDGHRDRVVGEGIDLVELGPETGEL